MTTKFFVLAKQINPTYVEWTEFVISETQAQILNGCSGVTPDGEKISDTFDGSVVTLEEARKIWTKRIDAGYSNSVAADTSACAKIEKAINDSTRLRVQLARDAQLQTKALLALYAQQTPDEQTIEQTTEKNHRGFNGLDAEILSSFAKQLQSRGFLSAKQFAILGKKLPKYEKQVAALLQL